MPEGHCTHAEKPNDEAYNPAAQAVQDMLPPVLYMPKGHMAQLDAVEPAAHADPAGQVQPLQTVMPVVEVKNPLGHT